VRPLPPCAGEGGYARCVARFDNPKEADMLLMQIDHAVELIRMEYDEWPGLKLTFWQAQRLWNLSDEVCARALQILTDGRFLTCAADGSYVRGTWPYAWRRSYSAAGGRSYGAAR
jgi:hypothetical protein